MTGPRFMRLPSRKVTSVGVSILIGTLAFFFFGGRDSQHQPSAPAKNGPTPSSPTKNSGHQSPVVNAEGDELILKAANLPSEIRPVERLAIVNALTKLGPGSEQKLAGALVQSSSLAGKAVLADALARIGTSESVDQLLYALASTQESDARQQIVRSFDAIPPGQPLETLVSSLVTLQAPQVRDGVIATVARAANADTVQFLNELFHEPVAVAGQTESIVGALSAIHNPEAAAPLLNMLRESGELTLMEASARSLSKIGTAEALQGIADSMERIGTTNPAFSELLIQCVQSVDNTAALPWLEKTMRSRQSDPSLAKAAATALNRLKAKT